MKRINRYDLYTLACEFYPLKQITREDQPANDFFLDFFAVNRAVRRLLSGKPIKLSVSRPAAQELVNRLKQIEENYFLDPETNKITYPDDDVVIGGYEIIGLKQSLENFEHVLKAELEASASYDVPQRAIYNTEDLIERADMMFPDSVRDSLNNEARGDFRAAGRCLAFNLPTASGFHIARAVERVLWDYYVRFTSDKVGKKTMGTLVGELKKLTGGDGKPLPDKKTLRDLDQFVEYDRNPLIHPTCVLEEDDALILFSNGFSAITSMVKDILAIVKTAKAKEKPKTRGLLANAFPNLEDAANADPAPPKAANT